MVFSKSKPRKMSNKKRSYDVVAKPEQFMAAHPGLLGQPVAGQKFLKANDGSKMIVDKRN